MKDGCVSPKEKKKKKEEGKSSPIPLLPFPQRPPQTSNPKLPTHPSHLTTHRNSDLLRGPLVARAHVLHFAHDVHALDHFAEDDVLAVEVRRGRSQDEELAAVGVGAGVLVGEMSQWNVVVWLGLDSLVVGRGGGWEEVDFGVKIRWEVHLLSSPTTSKIENK